MILNARSANRRSGSAAVEAAFLLMPLLILMAGVWEVARLVETEQVLQNAAREGARIAASGANLTIDGNSIGSSGSPSTLPQDATKIYLTNMGIDTSSGVTTTLTNTTTAANQWNSNSANGTSTFAPAKFDNFQMTVTVNTSKVRYIFLPNLINLGATLTATANWESMANDAVVVTSSLGPN